MVLWLHLEARVRELLLIAFVHIAEHDLARMRLVLLHPHVGDRAHLVRVRVGARARARARARAGAGARARAGARAPARAPPGSDLP